MLGWAANILIILSWYMMANKSRSAIILGIIGSFLWGIEGFRMCRWDLVTIEFILALLGLRTYLLWQTPRQ
jgi:hypothetical protein